MATFPSTTGAPGRWRLGDIREAKMGSNWPIVLTLAQQTFVSSGSWTAPTTTTLITTATGKGANGTPAGWYDLGSAPSGNNGPTFSYVEQSAPAGISSTLIESRAQTEWDKFPTSYNPSGQTVSWTYWYYYVNRTDLYSRSGTLRLKNGFAKTKVGNGWGASYTTNGSSLPSPYYYNYDVGNMEEYEASTNGASTTGFGYTFPGGSGGAASNTTYNNITVTPGQTYNIVVPSGGFLTWYYYQ